MNEADLVLPDAPRLIDLNQIATIEELVARREGITTRYNDFVGLLAARRSHLQEALRLVLIVSLYEGAFLNIFV